MTNRVGLVLLVVTTVALVLSGCAVEAPTVTSSTAVVPPSPRPAVAARTMASCAELETPAVVTALIGVASEVLDPHVGDLTDNTFSYAVEAAGGVSCLWGEPGALDPSSANTAFFAVRVLPHSDLAWKQLPAGSGSRGTTLGASYDGHESRGGNCSIGAHVASCWTDVSVNGNWLGVTARSIDPGAMTESAFHAVVLRMVPVLERYPSNSDGSETTVPTTSGIESTCYIAATAAAAAASFGVPKASYMGVETAFRIDDALNFVSGSNYCPFQPSDDGSGGFLVSYRVTPHARAQFTQYRALLSARSVVVSAVPLRSSGGSESAIGRSAKMSVGNDAYELDFLDGDNWINIHTVDATGAPAHAAAFAQWLLDHKAL